MSKIDATEALGIYRHFVNETEKVVEYLGVAKKLQNLLNVPIPNLRHVRPSPCIGSVKLTSMSGACVSCRSFGRVPQRPEL